jgi:ATP-dependent helicase HrpA
MGGAEPDRRPRLTYPEALPITAQRAVLLDAIRGNQVVVVAGETGSGKSTQLPKLCLELGRGADQVIGHTQPRRLAARTVAARIAEELGTTVGDLVGYKVRFSDQVSERTMVKLMTDGILLAELRGDRLLRRYDTIIVDEAHERSLNIDFLLGYLTDLLPRRPDLKVIVTSATIDTERFARHFEAPVVEVSGRSYPVEVRYRPIGQGGGGDADHGDADGGTGAGALARGVDQVDAIRLAVDELRAGRPGDILVFLSGERDIRDVATALTEANLPDTEILPLYARLSAREQERAFRPHRGRRIVLATNVAETSITVPGVRYVVDPGTARISRYSRRTKVQRLPIEPVSQASADQRAGRCGRVAPGICIRLYSEEDFAARPAFTEPEILRTNLASVILQLAGLGLGEVELFPFVDPPDARAVRDAVALLVELGAMRPDRSLTSVGWRLARLPLDPRYGRMLLEAEANACLREVTVIVAGLSIQDPRERPSGQEQEADELHARFAVPGSDFLAWLNLWEHLATEQRSRSGNQFRRMCRAEHLHHVRVREWQDLVRQLREAAQELGMRRNHQPADPDAIHRSLLAGLLSQVGMWDRSTRDFRGARQARFSVAPGSVLTRSSPAWVMAGELAETGRLWARTVARIDPSWIEPLADHLVQRHYGEARWSRRRGMGVTDERVLLYGLPVVPGRPVPLGRVDPELARTMFIEHALVAGDWDHGSYAFVDANRRLVEELRDLEARSRRRDLVLTDERLAELYDRWVPADVVSSRHFERWWRDARHQSPDLLTFTLDDFVEPGAALVDPADFPPTWTHDDLVLDLSYVFEPGADDDGVTVHVPLPVLPGLRPTGFDWQVPGHRLELVTALMRTLPKAIRRQLLPVAEHVQEAMAGLEPDDGSPSAEPLSVPLTEALARRLSRLTGTPVTPTDLDATRLPPHLRLRFSIEDDDGKVLAAGRDLGALSATLAVQARQALAAVAPPLERSGLRAWEVGTLPQTVETTVESAGRAHRVRSYPTLVDEGDAVGVRVVTTPADQDRLMLAGTRRLLLLAVPEARTQVERRLRNEPSLAVIGPGLPTWTDLVGDCLIAAADRILSARGGPAWDEDGHKLLEQAARDRLARLALGAAGPARDLVVAASALDDGLQSTVAPTLQPAVDDMRQQLSALVHPGFVSAAGLGRLGDLGRYLAAVRIRLDKLGERPDRDRDRMARAQALEAAYADLVEGLATDRRGDAEVVAAGWMLQELRVSFFAQALGTPRPVSEQRIARTLASLRSSVPPA